MRTLRGSLGIVVLGLVLVHGLPARPPAPAPEIVPIKMPETIIIDVGPVPPPRTRCPHRICVGEVQSLALQNSPLTDVIGTNNSRKFPSPWHDWNGTSKARIELLEQTRNLAAEELRNQNTATALDLYWRLTLALERCRLVALGKAELHSQLGRLDEAIAKELKAARDRDELALKISKVNSDDIALKAGLETLNDQLALLIGWDRPEGAAFIPGSQLRVFSETIDPEQAVAMGLFARADLKLIRQLESQIDSKTLPIVQKWLSSVNPLLGPMPLKSFVELLLRVLIPIPQGPDPDVADVRKQLQQIRTLRERQARADILRQIELVKLKYLAATQAQHRLEIQKIRLAAQQEKLDKELASEAEVSPVRLDVWQAEADRVQAAVEWEQSRVELRKLQGLLTTHPVEGACEPGSVVVAAPAIVPQQIFPQAFEAPQPGRVVLTEVPSLGSPPPPKPAPAKLPPPLAPGQFPPAFGTLPAPVSESTGTTGRVPGGP